MFCCNYKQSTKGSSWSGPCSCFTNASKIHPNGKIKSCYLIQPKTHQWTAKSNNTHCNHLSNLTTQHIINQSTQNKISFSQLSIFLKYFPVSTGQYKLSYTQRNDKIIFLLILVILHFICYIFYPYLQSSKNRVIPNYINFSLTKPKIVLTSII